MDSQLKNHIKTVMAIIGLFSAIVSIISWQSSIVSGNEAAKYQVQAQQLQEEIAELQRAMNKKIEEENDTAEHRHFDLQVRYDELVAKNEQLNQKIGSLENNIKQQDYKLTSLEKNADIAEATASEINARTMGVEIGIEDVNRNCVLQHQADRSVLGDFGRKYTNCTSEKDKLRVSNTALALRLSYKIEHECAESRWEQLKNTLENNLTYIDSKMMAEYLAGNLLEYPVGHALSDTDYSPYVEASAPAAPDNFNIELRM